MCAIQHIYICILAIRVLRIPQIAAGNSRGCSIPNITIEIPKSEVEKQSLITSVYDHTDY